MVKSLDSVKEVKKIYFDTYNVLSKTYYAIKDMTYNGVNTAIDYGVSKLILNLKKMYKSAEFVFIWDGRNSWRKEKYKFYKANRDYSYRDNSDFYFCVDNFRRLLPFFGVTQVEVEGYEADDIVGLLLETEKHNGENILVSDDWDWWAWLSDDTKLIYKGSLTSENELAKLFYRRYKCYLSSINRIRYFKVIIGDKSDNIDGIPRIPRKLASILASEGSSYDEWVLILHKMGLRKWEQLFIRNRELIYRNFDLIFSDKLMKGNETIIKKKSEVDELKLIEIFEHRGIVSLIEWLSNNQEIFNGK